MRTIVETSITNKSYLVIKTYKNTLNITHKRQTPNQLVAIELNHCYTVKNINETTRRLPRKCFLSV